MYAGRRFEQQVRKSKLEVWIGKYKLFYLADIEVIIFILETL